MALKDFDTELVSAASAVQVGVSDTVFLTQIASVIVGEPGQDGQDGLPGPPGGAVFEYQQGIPATQWNIEHNLGRVPPITVIDSAGTLQEGEYSYPDVNNVVLKFNFAFAGKAYLG